MKTVGTLLNLKENKICCKTEIPMIVSLITQHLMRRRSKLTKKERHNAMHCYNNPSYSTTIKYKKNYETGHRFLFIRFYFGQKSSNKNFFGS